MKIVPKQRLLLQPKPGSTIAYIDQFGVKWEYYEVFNNYSVCAPTEEIESKYLRLIYDVYIDKYKCLTVNPQNVTIIQ